MIEIDECHRSLITSLIRSSKPYLVLELGFGSGLTTKGILYALKKNDRGSLIVVDNLYDWDFKKPDHLVIDGFQFEEKTEHEYLETTNHHFDFVVCDADHNHTHEHGDLLLRVLNKNGFLVFHDVTNPMFPKLRTLLDIFPGGFLFQESSTQNEECRRGLYIWQYK